MGVVRTKEDFSARHGQTTSANKTGFEPRMGANKIAGLRDPNRRRATHARALTNYPGKLPPSGKSTLAHTDAKKMTQLHDMKPSNKQERDNLSSDANREKYQSGRVESYVQHARAPAPGAIGARLNISSSSTRHPENANIGSRHQSAAPGQSFRKSPSSNAQRTPPPEHQYKNTNGKGRKKGETDKNTSWKDHYDWGAD